MSARRERTTWESKPLHCSQTPTPFPNTIRIAANGINWHQTVTATRRRVATSQLPRFLAMRQATQAPRLLRGISLEVVIDHLLPIIRHESFSTRTRQIARLESRTNFLDDRTMLKRIDALVKQRHTIANQRFTLRQIKKLVHLHFVHILPKGFPVTGAIELR